MKLKNSKNLLLLLIIIAGLLRLGYLIEYRLKSPLYLHPITDSYMYMKWAREIAGGNWLGNSVFWQAPFYPYFLAFVITLFGQPFTFVYIVQLILGLINLLLVYNLAAKTVNKTVGLLALIICCFYAPFVYYETKLLADTFGIFFMLLCLNATIDALKSKSNRDFLLAGLFLGVGCVVRAFYLFYFLLSVFCLYLAIRKEVSDCLKKIIIYSLSCIAIISVVTIRNYAVGKDFVPISYSAGVTFYHGNNPYSRGGYGPGIARRIPVAQEEAESKRLAQQESGRPLKPSEVSNFWIKKGVLFLINNSKRAFWLLQRKFMLSLNNYEFDAAYHLSVEKELMIFLWLLFLPFGIISAFGACGMILAKHKIKTLWPFYVFAATMYLTLYIFYVSSRYRLHSVPLLAIFAGIGIEGFLKFWKQKKLTDIIILSALWTAMLSFSYLPTGVHRETAASRMNLGIAYLENGNRTKAMECYKKAVVINPRFSPAWMAIGNVYYTEGQYKKALQAYEHVIKQGPSRQYKRAKEQIEKCKENLLSNAPRS